METKTMNDAKDTVLSFLKALNADDFQQARKYANDNLSFVGVLGKRNSADEYFKDMEKMRFKYDIKKVFADGNDVCVLYDINMGGTKIFTCGWYKVKDNKIESIQVVFDPRPVLENAPKGN
jgi:limonene-1,2-epoxide hydrolase